MARFFTDDDADLSVLASSTIAIIGYGNQGRAHALNMRDSGLNVIVGSVRDQSFERAVTDGFAVMPIEAAVDEADVLCLLLPDETQREVYSRDVAPRLHAGHTLDFAHGYNIRFGHIVPPEDVDVVMVAPRMIGVSVRQLFEQGSGAPAFLAVHQDASGRAWPATLALAKALGATRSAALESTFAEETELDLFSEQAIWSTIIRLFMLSFEVLTEKGYQPEAVLLETYASGEPARVMEKMAEVGLVEQMRFHSRTSQYGTLSRGKVMMPDLFRHLLERVIDEIRDGTFAAEWDREHAAGSTRFETLKQAALKHPAIAAEASLHAHLESERGRTAAA